MAASEFGEQLLSEVITGNLHQLRRELGLYASPSTSTSRLGVPPLDLVVETFARESGAGVGSGAGVVEIVGVGPCSGKSALVNHVIALALMPKESEGAALAGRAEAVVIFDLGNRFCVNNLQHVIKSQIGQAAAGLEWTEAHIDALALGALEHLHIYRPESMEAFIAALRACEPNLLGRARPAHKSQHRRLGLLVIDDLSAFYWQERQQVEDEAAATLLGRETVGQERTEGVFVRHFRELVGELRSLQHMFGQYIIVTNRTANALSISQHALPTARSHLPAVWNAFSRLKLLVQRDKVSAFGPRMSLEEVVQEKDQRWQAVEKSGYSVWINHQDSEGWSEHLVQSLRSLPNKGAFSFNITSAGELKVESHETAKEPDHD